MASLIPRELMGTLKDAAEVKAIADEAVKLQDEMSAAYLINEAANTGQHIALWRKPMSDDLRQTLESRGYKINRRAVGSATEDFWAITGF